MNNQINKFAVTDTHTTEHQKTIENTIISSGPTFLKILYMVDFKVSANFKGFKSCRVCSLNTVELTEKLVKITRKNLKCLKYNVLLKY